MIVGAVAVFVVTMTVDLVALVVLFFYQGRHTNFVVLVKFLFLHLLRERKGRGGGEE